jgi:uncharacterized protein YpmB
MITVILSVLFIIAFVSISLLFQLSLGNSQQKRKQLSDKEVKIDKKKSLWISFFFYLFLAILVVIVHVFS